MRFFRMARFRLSVEFDDARHYLFPVVAILQNMGLTPKVEALAGPGAPSAPSEQTGPSPQITNAPVTKPAGDRDPWGALMALCNENQLRTLELVKRTPEGITSHEMAKAMGVDVTKVNGYVNGGLLRNIPKAGLDIGDVLVISKGKSSTYRPGKLLLTKSIPKGGAHPS